MGGARNYHSGNGNGSPKRAGEQTDYGDYNILMLDVLLNRKKEPSRSSAEQLSVDEIVPVWRRHLKTWRSWICTQTRQTLQQLNSGVPANKVGGYSNAMALRHAAAYAYFEREEDVVDAAHKSMFTHRETTAHDGAEFFARVTWRVIHRNLTPEEAIDAVAKESSSFIRKKVAQAKEKVSEATDRMSALSKEEFVDDLALTSMARLWDVGKSEPIRVGKASPTEGTLPGSIYFILKYAKSLEAAMEANAAVGGDNASRAIAIGLVLGAYLGVDAIPAHLKETLVAWKQCDEKLNALPYLNSLLQDQREL